MSIGLTARIELLFYEPLIHTLCRVSWPMNFCNINISLLSGVVLFRSYGFQEILRALAKRTKNATSFRRIQNSLNNILSRSERNHRASSLSLSFSLLNNIRASSVTMSYSLLAAAVFYGLLYFTGTVRPRWGNVFAWWLFTVKKRSKNILTSSYLISVRVSQKHSELRLCSTQNELSSPSAIDCLLSPFWILDHIYALKLEFGTGSEVTGACDHVSTSSSLAASINFYITLSASLQVLYSSQKPIPCLITVNTRLFQLWRTQLLFLPPLVFGFLLDVDIFGPSFLLIRNFVLSSVRIAELVVISILFPSFICKLFLLKHGFYFILTKYSLKGCLALFRDRSTAEG